MKALRKTSSAYVTRAEHDALRERLEDLEDALHMRAVEAGHPAQDYLPADAMRRLIAGEHPLRIWREQRGLTASALARRTGVPLSYISEIETGRKRGIVAAFKKLAAALALEIDDIVP